MQYSPEINKTSTLTDNGTTTNTSTRISKTQWQNGII
jgi:hypothetical protein